MKNLSCVLPINQTTSPVMLTYKLMVGNTVEWLYYGANAIKRAKFAAKLLLRRLNLQTAFIVPHLHDGETIIVKR